MGAENSFYLGVASSLCGRQWRESASDERVALALARRLARPEIVGRILASRGVAIDQAPDFLVPRLREALPDPSLFKDMDRAAERIASAIQAGETVAIFGDYDVDGATSAALLQRFIEAAGGRVTVHIPDRQKEGYGPNRPALVRLP